MLSGSLDGTLRRWDMDVDRLMDKAARTAGRNLSDREWQQVMPGQPYRETFPSLRSPQGAST
jgi:hypothetical protein